MGEKDSLSCSILLQKVSEGDFWQTVFTFQSIILSWKSLYCFFSYLNFKFNKVLFEKDKTANLYIQNIWIQRSIIKVFISNKNLVVIMYVRLEMTCFYLLMPSNSPLLIPIVTYSDSLSIHFLSLLLSLFLSLYKYLPYSHKVSACF